MLICSMGKVQPVKLGGTLKVPYVQELAKKPLSELPPRYAHPGQERASNADPNSKEVPVIDFQRLTSDQFSDSELLKLHAACAYWGFFHGWAWRKRRAVGEGED
ncbi:unnamed protein product [Rhodiola kirilowii]